MCFHLKYNTTFGFNFFRQPLLMFCIHLNNPSVNCYNNTLETYKIFPLYFLCAFHFLILRLGIYTLYIIKSFHQIKPNSKETIHLSFLLIDNRPVHKTYYIQTVVVCIVIFQIIFLNNFHSKKFTK